MFPNDTRILLIDDVPQMRELIRGQLVSLGYSDVTECGSSGDALKMILAAQRSGRPYQLVLVDWKMPGTPGIDVLKQARLSVEMKRIPFIFVSAEGEPAEVLAALREGASDYLVKPYRIAELKLTLERVWNQQETADSALAGD